MNHINKIYDGYKVIRSFHGQKSNNTIYVLENLETHEQVSIYYATFRRLVSGETTVQKILDWRNNRTRGDILNKTVTECSSELNKYYFNKHLPYGYITSKKEKKIVTIKKEAESVQFIFYAHDRLGWDTNKIFRTMNKCGIKYKKRKWTEKKVKEIISNHLFYKGYVREGVKGAHENIIYE